VSLDEVAEILSEALGRKIVYVRCDPQQMHQVLLASGMRENAADLMLEMYDAAEAGRVRPLQPHTADTTTPTTLAEFAREVIQPLIVEPAAHSR
jgi:hypothetical protein